MSYILSRTTQVASKSCAKIGTTLAATLRQCCVNVRFGQKAATLPETLVQRCLRHCANDAYFFLYFVYNNYFIIEFIELTIEFKCAYIFKLHIKVKITQFKVKY